MPRCEGMMVPQSNRTSQNDVDPSLWIGVKMLLTDVRTFHYKALCSPIKHFLFHLFAA